MAEKEKNLGRKLTDEEKSELAADVMNDYNDLLSKIRDGGFKSDDDMIQALNELGITKAIKDDNGNITGYQFDSLGMNTAVAQIQQLAEDNNIDKKAIVDMLGVDIFDKDFNGNLNTKTVSNIMQSTSKSLYGNKKGFFHKGDQYNPAVATTRDNNLGSKTDNYEIIRLSENTQKMEECNAVYGEHGEILRSVADAYKSEIAMEEKKIGVALREADAIKKAGKSWKDYSKLISEKYKIDEEAEKMVNGGFKVASNKLLNENGFTRITPSEIKGVLSPYTKKTTGLDEDVLRTRAANGLFKPKKGELVKAFGVDSEQTLNTLFSNSKSTIGGNLAHAIAQGDSENVSKFKKELQDLLMVFGKTQKEVNSVISAFEKAGSNLSQISDMFGNTVGNEIPIAGVSNDGNYLINGRMDTLKYQQRENKYKSTDDNKVYDDVYTILDYKTRAGTDIKADDVAQVAMYQEMLRSMQSTWMSDDRYKGLSDEELLKVARVDIAKALSGGNTS